MQADSGKKFHEIAGALSARGPDAFHALAGVPGVLAYCPIFVSSSVTVFDIDARKVMHETPAAKGKITAVSFAADGETLVLVDSKGHLIAWAPKTKQELGVHRVAGRVTGLAVDPTGARAAVIVEGVVKVVTLR